MIGTKTLELFAENRKYNSFLWRNLNALSPARGEVLDVGCGIGNLARLILEEPQVTGLHGIDLEPSYVQKLLDTVRDDRVSASACALEDFRPETHAAASDGAYDCIVCSNVLEHIDDDSAALERFRDLLRPGGQILVLVPAHPWIFSELDRGLSHRRRYTPQALGELAEASGLPVERMRHFNPLAVLGWWVNGKVLRRCVLPSFQLRAYTRLAVPLSALLDRCNPFPLGISLLALLRKPRGGLLARNSPRVLRPR